ncbi:hypothetical protein HKX48_004131 [Thoreauomyces humboldtii]|nr:hypothetical protein HKX48_004131 [Thoreauomyces humboldtii]
MKHGTRFWVKKLGRTPSHRASLLRNLLTQLVYHERIETTVAKAKFMQRTADRLIEMVKRATPQDLRKAKDLLFVDHITFNKLRGPLMARYATRRGGYTRLHMNGFRGLASDRAPLAIIELVDNPNDIIHGLAKMHLPKLRSQLADVEKKLYTRTVIPIQDPITGEPARVVRLEDRHDVPGREKRKLTGREKALVKMVTKMEKSLASYPAARAAEEEHAEKARTERAVHHKSIVAAVQEKLDEAMKRAVARDGGAEEDETSPSLGLAFTQALSDAELVITPGAVIISPKAPDHSATDLVTQQAQQDFVHRVRDHLDRAVISAGGGLASSSSSAASTAAGNLPSVSKGPFGPTFEAKFVIDDTGSLTILPSAAEKAYEGVGTTRVNPVHRDDYVAGLDVETVLAEEDAVPFEREIPDDVSEAAPSAMGRLWGKLVGGQKQKQ